MLRRCFLLFLLAAPAAAFADDALTQRILHGAYAQLGVTLVYDPRYTAIAYPGGDVPMERGVCSDVIVRAFRNAGIDLQRLVHEDMVRAFRSYPREWGLSRPDPNIDHRRVPNLAAFFTRHGEVLPVTAEARDYLPGDIVTWRLPDGRPHIGLISDKAAAGGVRLAVHNIGSGAQLEDILFKFPITGHYRYPPQHQARP